MGGGGGDIVDACSLGGWLVDLLTFGAPRADAILFADAFAPLRQKTGKSWRRQTSSLSRSRFGRTSAGDHIPGLAPLFSPLAPPGIANRCVSFPLRSGETYPVAVAAARAGHGLPLESRLAGLCSRPVRNLVSAAVRLGAIGQTDGQKIQATLMPRIRALAREASGASLTDLGACAFRSEIAAMRHETQYSRLFRS